MESSARTVVHFRDPHETQAWLSRANATDTYRVAPSGPTFDFQYESLSREGISVDRFSLAGLMESDLAPLQEVHVIEVQQGTVRARTGETRVVAGPGQGLLLGTHEQAYVHSDRVRVRTVRLDPIRLSHQVSEVLGIDDADVRFETRLVGTPGRLQHWSQAVRFVEVGVLGNPEIASNPLAMLDAWRLLTGCLLMSFPQPQLGPRVARTPGPAVSRSVRRAIAFMEAEAARPITITEVAAAARLTVRGTEAAFQRHLHTTPLAYLRRIRLAHAHLDLLQGDPTQGETVAAIAGRWGFTHLGRFSAQYRSVYGVTPRQTLWT